MELFKGVMYQHDTSARRQSAGVRGTYGAHALASELAPALAIVGVVTSIASVIAFALALRNAPLSATNLSDSI